MSDRVVAIYGIVWLLALGYVFVLLFGDLLIWVMLCMLMISLFYLFALMSRFLCVDLSWVVLWMFVMILMMFMMFFLLFHLIVNLLSLNLPLAHVHILLHLFLVANVLPNRKDDDTHTNQRKGSSANGNAQNYSLAQSFGIKGGVGRQWFSWLVAVGWLILCGVVCRGIVACGIVWFGADKLQLSGEKGIGWQRWLPVQGLPGPLQESVTVGLCWGHACFALCKYWPFR